MNPKSMLRRTLAMLLVLIFALSNMGLAEMADAVTDSLPAEAPQIEEIAEEAAPVEEQAEEAAPVEEEPAPVEEVPAEEAAAPAVSVELVQIDETSLCAYETVEPAGAYEVSYVWESAPSADGEWSVIEGVTGDVFASTDDARFDCVYRVTATAGGVSATSAPVAFDAGLYAEDAEPAEPKMIAETGDSFELTDVAARGDDDKIKINTGLTAKNAVIIAADKQSIALTLDTEEENDTLTGYDEASYTWTLTLSAENQGAISDWFSGEGTITNTGSGAATFTLAEGTAAKIPVDTGLAVDIELKITKIEKPTLTYTGNFTLLRKLQKSDLGTEPAPAVTVKNGGKDVTALKKDQTLSLGLSHAATIAKEYEIKYTIGSLSDEVKKANDYFDDADAGGSVTAAELRPKAGAELAAPLTFKITAAITGTDVSVESGTLTLYAAATASGPLTVESNKTKLLEGDTETTLTIQSAVTTAATAYMDDFEWTVESDNDEIAENIAQYVTLTPIDNKKKATFALVESAPPLTKDTTFTVSFGPVEGAGLGGGITAQRQAIKVFKKIDSLEGKITISGNAGVNAEAKTVRQNAYSSSGGNDTTVQLSLGGEYASYLTAGLATWTLTHDGKPAESERAFVTLSGETGASPTITIKALDKEESPTNGVQEANKENGEPYKIEVAIGDATDSLEFHVLPAATGVTLKVTGETPDGKADQELKVETDLTTVGVPLKLVPTIASSQTGVPAWENGRKVVVYKEGDSKDYSSETASKGTDYTTDKDGNLIFNTAGKYGVELSLDGYEPAVKNTDKVRFEAKDLLTAEELSFGELGESKVLIGSGDSVQLEIATNGEGTEYTNYTWELEHNEWGSITSGTYVDITKTKANGSGFGEYTGDPIPGTTIGLELTVSDSINNGTDTQPVTVTVTTPGKVIDDKKNATKKPISKTFSITVIPEASDLSDSNIDFLDEIPIPKTADKNGADLSETDAWKKYTQLKLDEANKNYTVNWSIVTEQKPDHTETPTQSNKYVSLTSAGVLTLKHWGDDDNFFTAADANGVKITFRAEVQNSNAADQVANKTYLYKTVTLKPEPDSIGLQVKAGNKKTPNPSQPVTADITADGSNAIYARKGYTLEFNALLKGPSVTDETATDSTKQVEIKPFGSVSGLTWTIKQASKLEGETDKFTTVTDLAPNASNTYVFTDRAKEVDHYQIQIENATGMTLANNPVDVYIQQGIKSIDVKIDGDAARTSVYENKDTLVSLALTGEDGTVYNTDDTTAKLDEIYTQDVGWTFPSNMDSGVALKAYVVGSLTAGDSIKTTDHVTMNNPLIPYGTLNFWINIPDTATYTGKTLSFTAGDYPVNSSGTHAVDVSKQKTINVYAAVGSNPFTGYSSSNPALKFAETDSTGKIGRVAQNSTLQATLDTAITSNNDYKNLKYTYSLTGYKDTGTTQIPTADIDSWATIDDKGLISVKPLEAGANAKNKIADGAQYAKLTVRVAVVGYESTFNTTADFYVYREPVAVKVEQVSVDADSKEMTQSALPKAMRGGNVMYVTGSVVGPDNASGEPTESVGTVKLTFRNASSTPLSMTSISPDATGDYKGYYKLSPKTGGTGTIEITATCGTLSKTYSISVLKENIVSASGQTKCTATEKNPSGVCDWVLVAENEQTNPKGHIYKCSFCGDTSEPVAHAALFDLVDEGPNKNDADFDAYVIGSEAVFACPICQYKCDHADYEKEKKDAKRLDGTIYHTAVCPTCGQTLKQEHQDNGDGVCRICGDSSAMPWFKGSDGQPTTTMQVVVGESATPDLYIDNSNSWSVVYTTEDSHIKVVEPESGKIEGVSLFDASDAKQTATLNAKVTVYTIDPTTKKPVGQDINTSIEVEVIAHPTTIQVVAERDFVIEANTADAEATGQKPADVTANTLLKLTAQPDIGVEQADLAGYTWQLYTEKFADASNSNTEEQAKTHAELEAYFDFYELGSTGTLVAATDLSNPEIWVAVKKGSPLEPKYNGHLFATYKGPASTTVPQATVTPAKFDVLGAYEDLDLSAVLELDKDQVVQDDTVNILEDKYDSRYGEITYSLKLTDNISGWDGLSQTMLNKWASVSGKTVTVNPAGVDNALPVVGYQLINITAEILGPKQANGTAPVLTHDVLGFTVVDKTAAKTIKLQYKDDPAGAWADIPADKTVMPGDEIYLKVLVLKEDNTVLGTNSDEFNWKNFAWTKPDAAVAKFENETLNSPNGVYKVTFQKVSASTEAKFTATSGAGSDSATFTIKPLISKITLSADSSILVPDEQEKVNGENVDKNFTFTYSVEPADATDTLKWHIYDAADEAKADLLNDADPKYDLKDAEVEGATNVKKVIAIDKDKKRDLIIVAEPTTLATELDADGKPVTDPATDQLKKVQVTSNELAVTAYKLANDGEAALLFTVEGSAEAAMSVGETKTIDKHEYNIADGYYSTLPLGAIAVEQTPEKTGDTVVTVDQENYTVTAVNPGTAVLKLRTYYWEEGNAERLSTEKKINITVEAAADSLKFADTVKVEEGYDLTVGKRPYETIATGDITAMRSVEGSETGEKVESATVELVSDNPAIVKVNETATGWELEPVAKGETNIVAKVGAAVSQSIPVRVKAAPTGIKFFVDGEEVVGTEKQLMKDSDAVTITWALDPADADAEYYPLTVTKGGEAVTGESISFTPDAVGTTTIEAQTNNKDYVSGVDSVTNQMYLKAHLDLVVTEEGGDEPIVPPTPSTSEVKFVNTEARAIGPEETTKVYVTGVAEGESVAWSTEPASGVISVEPDKNDPTIATVSYVALGEGKASIIATISGTDTAERTAEASIYTLTAPKTVALERYDSDGEITKLTMGNGETVEVFAHVTEGYDFATPELAQEAENDDVDAYATVTITSDNEKFLTVDRGIVTAKAQPGKKDAAPNLIITAPGLESSLKVPVEIVKKNTSFNIGAFNGSTLYMYPGDSKTIEVKTSPSTSFVNLSYDLSTEGDVEFDYDDLSIAQDGKVLTVKASETATAGITYKVVLSARGYTNHADQSFTVVVQDKAEEGDEPMIAVRKVGTVGTGYTLTEEGITSATDSITAVKGETLQAYFVNKDGTSISGTMSWTKLTAKQKKKVTISDTGLIKAKGTSGSVIIEGSVNGITAKPITINLQKAKTVALEPAETTRMVACDEEFQLKLTTTTTLDTKVAEWYTISFTDDLGFEKSEDEEKADTYTFAKAGVTTVTLQPVWGGKAKTVKFTVVDEKAEDFEVPETATVAPTGNTIIHANLVGGYANLTWRMGETEASPVITTKQTVWSGVSGIKVKKLANDEIQITASKAAAGTTMKLLVQSADKPDGKAIEVSVKAADTGFPTGATVVFDKPVITVGESTTVSVQYPEDVETPPTGTIKYAYAKSDGKVKVSGNVVKATKKGLVTVTAKLGSGAPIQGTLFVLPKASIVTSMKPTAMGEYERLTMDVTIKDYDKGSVPATPESLSEGFSTAGVLSAESNSSLIKAELSQDPETETPNVYQLTLSAGEAVKTTKGKFTSATITLRLTNGAKKTFKIQVIDYTAMSGRYDVQLPESITVAKGMSVTLNPAVPAGMIAPNYSWHFAEDSVEAAKTHKISIQDGKIVADAQATATSAEEPIIIEAEDEYEEDYYSIKVNVVETKVGKNGFTIQVPNRTLYAGENILATVKYNPGVGAGDVTWKSNRSTVISVDKKTGLLTVKGPYKKYTTAKITATANKKTASATLNVAPAVSKVAFKQDVLSIDPTKNPTVDVASYVLLDGSALGSGDAVKGVVSFDANIDAETEIASIDEETGLLTIATAPEGETISGVVNAIVRTYNGLSAMMPIVIGAGSDSGEVMPPAPPVKEQILESVDLWVGGYPLKSDEQIELVEGDTFNPSIDVKDTEGLQILDGYTAEWTVVEEDMADRVELDKDTGKLVAKKYTLNDTDGSDRGMTIKVTVTKGEKNAEATYSLRINPKFGTDHFVFTPEKTSLVEGESTTATFKFDNTAYNDLLTYDHVEITSKTPETISVERVQLPSGLGYTITAKKSGTATIEIVVTDNDRTKYTKTENFEIIAKPESDLLSIEGIDAAAGLTLAEGEVQEFAAVLDASFIGTQTANDFTYSFEHSNGTVWTESEAAAPPITIAQKAVESTDPTAETEYEVGKFIITAKDGIDGLPEDHVTVVVKAYGKAEKKFSVKVEKAPEVKIEATPKASVSGSGDTASAGVGESVTLTVKQTKASGAANGADHYYNGVELRITSPIAGAVPEGKEPTLVPGEGDSATLTYNDVGTVTVGVFHKGAQSDAAPIGGSGFEVTFKPVPTGTTSINGITVEQTMELSTDDGKSVEPDAGVYTIGEGEKITASFAFADDSYSKEITWKEETGKVSLNWLTDDDDGDFTTCEITGVSKTSAGATVTVSAYYNERVLLGSIKLRVVGKATEINLVQGDSDTKVPFDFSVPSDSSEKTVYAAFNEGAQIDCDLISDDTSQSIIEVKRTSRTTWTLKRKGATGTVTLTLKSSTGMIKRYIVRIQ